MGKTVKRHNYTSCIYVVLHHLDTKKLPNFGWRLHPTFCTAPKSTLHQKLATGIYFKYQSSPGPPQHPFRPPQQVSHSWSNLAALTAGNSCLWMISWNLRKPEKQTFWVYFSERRQFWVGSGETFVWPYTWSGQPAFLHALRYYLCTRCHLISVRLCAKSWVKSSAKVRKFFGIQIVRA